MCHIYVCIVNDYWLYSLQHCVFCCTKTYNGLNEIEICVCNGPISLRFSLVFSVSFNITLYIWHSVPPFIHYAFLINVLSKIILILRKKCFFPTLITLLQMKKMQKINSYLFYSSVPKLSYQIFHTFILHRFIYRYPIAYVCFKITFPIWLHYSFLFSILQDELN